MEKKTCDVVVIGAGIGGLCVAARLSHAGYKTIVLERMPILGGRYTLCRLQRVLGSRRRRLYLGRYERPGFSHVKRC